MAHQVLHLLGTAQPECTGMARIVSALAQGLDPERYHLHACFLAGAGPLVGALQKAGVEASALDWWRGAQDPLGAWKFWSWLRRQKFDIVQLHFGGRSVCWLARAATQAKIIRHLHGRILEPQGLTPVYFSARGTDAVVAVSQAVANRVVDGRARVIYAGLTVPPGNPSAPRHRATSEIILGTAGRLVELKGIEYLVATAAALRREFPALRVEIAGSGPQREKLETAVAHAGLKEQVKFLGWTDDLAPVLARWDVYVMPSLEEGFPIAALDAMAAGLPVVATSVGGVPELIEDGKTGWLVEPRDADALASRLRVLLANPELRRTMGAAGFCRVRDHFSAAQMTASFAQLYDELLHEPRKQARADGTSIETLVLRGGLTHSDIQCSETRNGCAPFRGKWMKIPGELLPQTSVIICTVDRLADLERCLESVRPFRAAVAEIIIVNNGPRLAAVEEIATRFDSKVITEPRRGSGRARNAGIRAATGEVIAFLDDDAQACEDWLEPLVAPFADPTVNCVLGAIQAKNPADPVHRAFEQSACPPLPRVPTILDARAAADGFPLRMAMKGLSGNVAFRRDVFERFGYFDPRFGPGTKIRNGDDTELFFKVLRRGGRILFAPSSRVVHSWSVDWKAFRRSIFNAGCGHTAILTKYFLEEPSLRRAVLHYAASRLQRQAAREAPTATQFKVPRLPLLLGSLYGPIAFLLSGKE